MLKPDGRCFPSCHSVKVKSPLDQCCIKQKLHCPMLEVAKAWELGYITLKSPCISIISPCMNIRQQYIVTCMLLHNAQQPDSLNDGKTAL